MVDPVRLRALLERLAEETTNLRRLSEITHDELLSDPDKLSAIKYRFVIAIETCIDAGQHVISSENLRPGTDAADVFQVLGEKGLLEQASVASFKAMARFRNLLVHGYAVVDDERVLAILDTQLDDFDSFRSQIARLAK